jgi:hypothetical protein
MEESMKRSLKVLAAFAPLFVAVPAVASAQAGAPVVAVLAFNNNSITADARDFDGIGKAVADLMTVDLASSPKLRVVERSRVAAILDEQKLSQSGAVSSTEAVRVGKLLSACYSVYGMFMRDRTGQNVLTVTITNNETSQVLPGGQKKVSKGDDVLELIDQATKEFLSKVNLTACPGTSGTPRSGDASPAATQQSSATKQVPVVKETVPAAAAPAASTPAASGTQLYAKPLTETEMKKVKSQPLDARTTLLYSRALDAKDKKETAKAIALFKQVLAKNENFVPARQALASLE